VWDTIWILILPSNTAQVLTSLAEIRNEGKILSESNRDAALRLFHEALELFQRCLNVQEIEFAQAQESSAQDADRASEADELDTGEVSGNASDASEGEIWASVEEPITKDTLLDTAVAQLDTLTAICSLNSITNENDLAWMDEYYRNTLQPKIITFTDSSTHHHEAALAKAKFVSAISDAAFRSGRLDITTYERELKAAFNHQDLDLTIDPQGLCDRADAYLAFSTSIQLFLHRAQADDIAPLAAMCWKHITRALDSFTAASKIPDAQNLPRIHLRRGDCELLRLRLGEEPLNYDLAMRSAPTLVKNGEFYFRGAAKLAKSEGAAEEQAEAEIKEAAAAALGGDMEKMSALVELQRQLVEAGLEEMRDEGLLGEQGMRKIEKFDLA